MAGAVSGDVFIGRKAQELRGLLKLNWPMEGGVVCAFLALDPGPSVFVLTSISFAIQVKDWDDMERIWQWVYSEELGTLSEEVRYPLPSPCYNLSLTITFSLQLVASRTPD
jgi:centractin